MPHDHSRQSSYGLFRAALFDRYMARGVNSVNVRGRLAECDLGGALDVTPIDLHPET